MAQYWAAVHYLAGSDGGCPPIPRNGFFVGLVGKDPVVLVLGYARERGRNSEIN